MTAKRAAIELLGAMVVAAALLATPFVYGAIRLDRAMRVPPARVAEIERAGCSELRNMGFDESALGIAFWPPSAEQANREDELITARGRQLHCRPPIESQLSAGGSD
jgi:hypothetical protein